MFLTFINDYVYASKEVSTAEDLTGSPYPFKVILLLFAIMAVYYYCFFLAGGYIMQCFRYGRKKTYIYYFISCTAIFLGTHSFSDIGSEWVVILLMNFMIISILTNPIVFLYAMPVFIQGESPVILIFLLMTAFILITAASIEILGLMQFPSKRHIKRLLKNIEKTEAQKNDGQT